MKHRFLNLNEYEFVIDNLNNIELRIHNCVSPKLARLMRVVIHVMRDGNNKFEKDRITGEISMANGQANKDIRIGNARNMSLDLQRTRVSILFDPSDA